MFYIKKNPFKSDRNSLVNKLVPNQSIPRGALCSGTFCLHYFFIFFDWKIPYYKILSPLSCHFSVLDALNVAQFSCRFSRHLKCKMVHSASSQYSGQFHAIKMVLNDKETLAELKQEILSCISDAKLNKNDVQIESSHKTIIAKAKLHILTVSPWRLTKPNKLHRLITGRS